MTETIMIRPDSLSVPPLQPQQPQDPQGCDLYIDTDDRTIVFFFYSILAVIVIALLFSALAMPRASQIFYPDKLICDNPVKIRSNRTIQCRKFDVYSNPILGIYLQGLTNLNQNMVLSLKLEPKDNKKGMYLDQKVYCTVYSIKIQRDKPYIIEREVYSNSVTLHTSVGDPNDQDDDTQTLYPQVLFLHNIPSENILFTVRIPNLTKSANIKTASLYVTTVNPNSTRLHYNIRIAFFCISAVAFFAFVARLSLMHRGKRMLEHRFILVLGSSLVLFNDPFFIITLTKPNNASSIISQCFSLIYPLVLTFFWMSLFEKINNHDPEDSRRVMTSYIKWIIISITTVALFGFYLFTACRHQEDFMGNNGPSRQTVNKLLLIASEIMIGVCYVVILHFLAAIMFCFPDNMKKQRDWTIVNVSLFFVLFTLIAMLVFSLDIFANWPRMTFLLSTLFNLYTIVLQILYSPTKVEIRTKYPSRLTNAQVAQRVMDHLQIQFVNPLVEIHQHKNTYNNVNEEVQVGSEGMRSNSALQSDMHHQQYQMPRKDISLQDWKRGKEQVIQIPLQMSRQPNYDILPVDGGDTNNFSIEDQKQEEQEEPIQSREIPNGQQSRLLTLSQSEIAPQSSLDIAQPSQALFGSEIIGRTQAQVESGQSKSISNILDQVYQRNENQPQAEQPRQEQRSDEQDHT